MPESVLAAPYETIPILDMAEADLESLSRSRKLSLGISDLLEIKSYFKSTGRNPTCVELETIAQTWSEHCKHRIFNARIVHRSNRDVTPIDGLFETFIRNVTEEINRDKPDFVLSAFRDNAGFINLNGRLAACLKVETHNHPSAIEPYGGANTGLGGVIRDVLGAGKGAKPVASIDAFCVGMPAASRESIPADRIHPLGVLRGVVRGVRDYGNRMGIPTIAGAIVFDSGYALNPLVFCGTAGVLPVDEILKEVRPELNIVLLGGRTGRDGLHGATFSSASLTSESPTDDRRAVQIGNPIEEKKLMDCVLKARERGLIDFITDCGAGGLSSAAGEMVSETGGRVYLDRVPLKEENLACWEIFLSESQERMVLGVRDEHLDALRNLAEMYDTECTVIGETTDTGSLEVFHQDIKVCDLECEFLHSAPRRTLRSEYRPRAAAASILVPPTDLRAALRTILSDVNVASREPVIRQYDHEVQGNTVIKPLGGLNGDNPADGTCIRVDGSGKSLAIGVALSPSYGVLDPYRMGQSCVDEAIRQVVVAGANPDLIALLDNFCMGNPDDPEELGALVECVRGMSAAAQIFKAPFISGKDSFYNCYESTDGRTVSIPVTLLVSALGVVEEKRHLTTTAFRRANSMVCLLGTTHSERGAGVYERVLGETGGVVPGLDPDRALELYRCFYRCVREGWVRSAHDLSDGGLAVALAEMAFASGGGVEIDLHNVSCDPALSSVDILFSESNSRILFESDVEHLGGIARCFDGLPFSIIGRTIGHHSNLVVRAAKEVILNEPLKELKLPWKNGLQRYF